MNHLGHLAGHPALGVLDHQNHPLTYQLLLDSSPAVAAFVAAVAAGAAGAAAVTAAAAAAAT